MKYCDWLLLLTPGGSAWRALDFYEQAVVVVAVHLSPPEGVDQWSAASCPEATLESENVQCLLVSIIFNMTFG